MASQNVSANATIVCVPTDAPFPGGSERPTFIRFGWKLPAAAIYADSREVEAPTQWELAEMLGLDRRTMFAAWQGIDESDEAYRLRSLPTTEHSTPEGRWCVRLDWGRAYVLRSGTIVGTSGVWPLGRGRVRVERYPDQPDHTVEAIEFLALLVAGEQVGTPVDDDLNDLAAEFPATRRSRRPR